MEHQPPHSTPVTRSAGHPVAHPPHPPSVPQPVPTTLPPTAPPSRAPLGGAGEESPVQQLRRAVRRQQGDARDPRQDLVWQPRFAYTSAVVIAVALSIVSLPLWIVLYGITDASANDSAGAPVADVVALCMMLLGGFLAGTAAWVIIIEMRGRVRMVDTLAKTGEREMVAPAAPEIPVLDAPLGSLVLAEPIGAARSAPPVDPAWDPAARAASLAARAEAAQVSAAATLEASSRLLGSFSGVLRSFGQLPAQVAMLTVALALFVGATVLSLHP